MTDPTPTATGVSLDDLWSSVPDPVPPSGPVEASTPVEASRPVDPVPPGADVDPGPARPAVPAPPAGGRFSGWDAGRPSAAAPRPAGWRAAAARLRLPVAPLSPRQRREADVAALAWFGSADYTIMAANPKGGVGKTPLAILIAAAIARHSGSTPILIDNNPTGNLAKRLERSDHSLTMDDLIGWLGRTDASTATAADVRSFLRFQPDGRFTALAARERPFKRLPDGTVELLEPTVTQAEFRAVWETVRRHHCPVVIDAGNNDADAPWRAALAVTDQLVVPVQWRKDACDAAVRLLGVMEETGHGRLVDQAIVVNMTKPGPRPDKARARRYRAFFERAGLLVVDVPIDPVIAGDDAMAWSRLDPATREAGVRLCAEITRRTSRP